MKKLIFFCLISLISSCSNDNGNSKNSTIKQNNIVAEVESRSSSSFRSGSYDHIVNALYLELIKNDENLKKLDDEFQNSIQNTSEALKFEEDKIDKPKEYFDLINNEIENLKDSTEKIQLKNIIKDEFAIYKMRNDELLKKQLIVDKNFKLVNDAYFVFKVRKTLPEMKKYINQNPINLENIDKSIQQQKVLFDKMKNLK